MFDSEFHSDKDWHWDIFPLLYTCIFSQATIVWAIYTILPIFIPLGLAAITPLRWVIIFNRLVENWATCISPRPLWECKDHDKQVELLKVHESGKGLFMNSNAWYLLCSNHTNWCRPISERFMKWNIIKTSPIIRLRYMKERPTTIWTSTWLNHSYLQLEISTCYSQSYRFFH